MMRKSMTIFWNKAEAVMHRVCSDPRGNVTKLLLRTILRTCSSMEIRLVLCATLALTAEPSVAKLSPAPLFNHNMVVQRDRKVAVWGDADPLANVTVGFGGNVVSCAVSEDGCWRVDLPPMQAEAMPQTMTIKSTSGEVFVCTNVVVGEVWLCGGQSNMTLSMCPKPSVGRHAGRERNGYFDINLTNEPDVRGVRVSERFGVEPTKRSRLNWFTFTSGNGSNFSGAAWHYALRLYGALKIPVGVIESAWGGSTIETWISAEAFASSKSFREFATRPIRTVPNAAERARQEKTGRKPSLHQQPRACWNAMIHPLIPYGLRGAIWYQGCANRRRWRDYYELLEILRAGWSSEFECPNMPFFLCQIAPYGYTEEEEDDGDVQIREEMARFAHDYAPNVGMAVLSDVGEIDCIHPGDKRTVGTRLAALALNRVYGMTNIKCDAPELESAKMSKDEKTVLLTFRNVEDWCLSGNYRLRFELAGSDGKYEIVDCRVISKSNRVELIVPDGLSPKSVAYMRKSCVYGFLKNEAGLPLGPFRCGIVGQNDNKGRSPSCAGVPFVEEEKGTSHNEKFNSSDKK